MPKKTTSLKIDEELWKRIKIHCINEGLDISEFIERISREAIKKK